MTTETSDTEGKRSLDFIRQAVKEDVENGRYEKVITRFPPEPNGYLHIGHAMAFGLDFEVADEHGGECNLRFDDTNPVKEEEEYVDAIIEDIRWLGFDWGDRLYFASDYFDQLYEYAIRLIKKGKAFVCDLSQDEMREYRGTLTEPGRNSPNRDRSVEENLDLFEHMRAGEFGEGSRTLRAKIDMAAPNINMRDPVMYRIQKTPHHRTGDAWCIYPIYDFAHGQSDSIEHVSHSLCSHEYIDHRPLYDWYIRELEIFPSRQIEFARVNLTYSMMSKRRLLRLVEEGGVTGWDDPRMVSLRGLRRRGYTPESVRKFVDLVGVTNRVTTVEIEQLEHCVRDHLNKVAPRVMGVINPLRVVIENYPEGKSEEMEAVNNPEDPSAGRRKVPFSRVLYIERDDFMEDPPKKFYRLAPGREVRLRYAYFITCREAVKDENGEVVELRCTYDPETRGGDAPNGRKVKATLHWVSAEHAEKVEVRLYDRLFRVADPMKAPEGGDWVDNLNPDSLEVRPDCYVEPSLKGAEPGYRCQFERLGYFCVDPDSSEDGLVFNRTVTLRDSWARMAKKKGK